MSRYLGSLKVWADGDVAFQPSLTGPPLSVDHMEIAFRAAVGARAAMQADAADESVTRLAASLLAKAGAAKARAIREAAEEAVQS